MPNTRDPLREVDLLAGMVRAESWEYLKEELMKLKARYEVFRRRSVKEGDVTNATYLEGLIEGLEIVCRYPDELLAEKSKPKFKDKISQAYENGKNNIQSLFESVFKDFPDNQEKTTEATNGGLKTNG